MIESLKLLSDFSPRLGHFQFLPLSINVNSGKQWKCPGLVLLFLSQARPRSCGKSRTLLSDLFLSLEVKFKIHQ